MAEHDLVLVHECGGPGSPFFEPLTGSYVTVHGPMTFDASNADLPQGYLWVHRVSCGRCGSALRAYYFDVVGEVDGQVRWVTARAAVSSFLRRAPRDCDLALVEGVMRG